MNYSQSASDMKRRNPSANFVPYDIIHKINNIDELLGSSGMAYILYLLQSPNYGHWVCLFKRGDKLSYFNSYGFEPDDDFKYAKKGLRKLVNEEEPYLFELLSKSGYQCEYNDHKLQSDGSTVCGLWVIDRLNNKKLSPDEYATKIFKYCNQNKITPDQYLLKKYM